MAKVSTIPDNIEFNVSSEETILAAGLNQKLNLPHSCKKGTCGACKCKIISGEVALEPYNSQVLSEEEKEQGYTLLCKAHAVTDVVVDLPNLLNAFPIRVLPAKVDSIQKINDLAIITLKLPANQQFGFHAGQYIDILLAGKNRSYSIASSPTNAGKLELHVRYHAGGVFAEFVWNELQEKQILRFRGPLGSFHLQDTNAPIILICTGAGFAPIKAILEDLVTKKDCRPIHLYWGNRTLEDFYLVELIKKWQQELNLTVRLCVSQAKAPGYSEGYVTQTLNQDFNDLSQYEVYACGNLNMIEDVYALATGKLHLAKENFFADAFTPSV